MPDLRLVIPAVALWICCGVGIGVIGAMPVVAVCAGALATTALLAAAWSGRRGRGARRSRGLAALAVALAAAALGAAAIGAQATGPRETSELRLAGYRTALREAGIAEDPALIRQVIDFRRSDGVAAVDGLLAEGVPFDGVFAFNDLMALGALHALGEAGLRVPEDVAVVGFDDIEEDRYSTPPLTTVAPDKAALGSLALELLLSDSPAAGDTTVPYQIVSRMSA